MRRDVYEKLSKKKLIKYQSKITYRRKGVYEKNLPIENQWKERNALKI